MIALCIRSAAREARCCGFIPMANTSRFPPDSLSRNALPTVGLNAVARLSLSSGLISCRQINTATGSPFRWSR